MHPLAQNCERIPLVLSLKNMGLLFFRQINLVLSLPMETLVIFSRNLGYDIFTIAAVKSDNSFVCSALNSNKWVNPKKTLLALLALLLMMMLGAAAIPAINQGFATLGNDD